MFICVCAESKEAAIYSCTDLKGIFYSLVGVDAESKTFAYFSSGPGSLPDEAGVSMYCEKACC